MLSEQTVLNLALTLAHEGELLTPDRESCFVVTDYTHRMTVNPGEKTILYRWETPADPSERAKHSLDPDGPDHLEFTVPLTPEISAVLDARIAELQEEAKGVDRFLYGGPREVK